MKLIIIAVLVFVAFLIVKGFLASKDAPQNIQIALDFLVDNEKKSHIKTTDSGLQYEVLTAGTGTVHPDASSKVTVHYHGTLLDGTVFDSSVERDKTISFKLNQVIKGWTEGVQLMVVGDKYRFYIASDLAYGKRSVGKIPPGSLLIFDIELFEIN